MGSGEDLHKFGGNDMGDFQELFMSKFFPASAKYAKAQEFLGLRPIHDNNRIRG